MYPGEVGKVREMKRGIEADVCIGMSADGTAVIRLCSNTPKVKKAMEGLRKAMREEAHELLLAAQDRQIEKGRTAIGRSS